MIVVVIVVVSPCFTGVHAATYYVGYGPRQITISYIPRCREEPGSTRAQAFLFLFLAEHDKIINWHKNKESLLEC